MQKELTEEGYDIYILGINEYGFDVSNEQVTQGRDIPWLQDQEDILLWTTWGVSYRDVLIFDEDLILRDVINLSQFDLRDESNYASFLNSLTTL